MEWLTRTGWKRWRRPSQVAVVLAAACALAFAQQSSSSSSGSSNSPDAPAQKQSADQAAKDKKKNPPAKQTDSANPFPAAQSEAAAKTASQSAPPADQHVAPGSTPPAQTGNGNGSAKHSTAQDNPFPESKSEAAAKASGNQNQPVPSSGPSSSLPGVSSSNAHLPPQDLGEGNKGFHAGRLDTYTSDMTNSGRVADDLNTADLYMKNGNYRGGGMRYQDALRFDPQNETAAFGLAEAMCKQDLSDKAMQQYQSYLNNFPQGKYAGKAQKMLSDRKKCTHNR